MAACTFFGHRECFGLDAQMLMTAIDDLIRQGVDTFYVGNQGQFDAAVYRCLTQLRQKHPHIRVCVVLAYLPTVKNSHENTPDTMYPEIEGDPKFAIERRNRWMIGRSDCCICHISHTWGGAYKFARLAKQRGKRVINLGRADLKG